MNFRRLNAHWFSISHSTRQTAARMTLDRLTIVGLAFAVLVIGLIKIIVRLRGQVERETLVHEFLEKLRDYAGSRGGNGEAYGWLTMRANKMQNQLGGDGIFAAYRPPYARHQFTNYPIILNMLPELRQAYGSYSLSDHVAPQLVAVLQEALIRHVGTLQDQRTNLTKQLKNPFVWLREGVRFVLELPLSLLYAESLALARSIGSSAVFYFASRPGSPHSSGS
jgi:hypothetical protein